MNNHQLLTQFLDFYSSQFRILEEWIVYPAKEGDYTWHCVHDNANRRTAVYPCPDAESEEQVEQYALHEVLHAAIRALKISLTVDELEEAREKEEGLVQDLCLLVK
jgi:Lon protease-like protein